MWLTCSPIPRQDVTRQDDDAFLDRLLDLSPDVYRGPGDAAVVSMLGTAHYWLLPDLLGNEATAHPLKTLIASLAADFGSRFTLAPTPALSFWAAEALPSEAALHVWTQDSLRASFSQAPISTFRFLLADLEGRSARHREEADTVAERFEELGLRSLADLEALRVDPKTRRELHARLGGLGKTLLDRLKGSESFQMKRHEPAPIFFKDFHPELEKSMGVEGAEDLFARLHEILQSWQKRLEARKAALKGLELAFRGAHGTRLVRLDFASPLKEAAALFQLVQEKCLKSDDAPFFDMPVEHVFLRSLGLENLQGRQLSLFESEGEASDESWSLLVGRLLARSSAKEPVQVGRFEAGTSYTPENSVVWKPWKPGEALIKVERHPSRPQTLLPKPQRLDLPMQSEGSFCAWVSDKKALGTLERIGEDRLYARVDKQWVYWCAKTRCTYLHGLFEGYGLEKRSP